MIRPRASPVHLDTSFLIRALDPSSSESAMLQAWLRDRRSLAISAFAWGEFLCGPLDMREESVARRIVHRTVPVGSDEATEAARLFNRGGRRRHSFPDCIIAATAILSHAELATSNAGDFERFIDAGLELAG